MTDLDPFRLATMRRVKADLQRLDKTLSASRLQLIQLQGQLFLECQLTGARSLVELSRQNQLTNLQAQEGVDGSAP